jgi:hypothetical protein
MQTKTRKRNEAFRKIQPNSATARRQAARYLDEQKTIKDNLNKPMGGIEAVGRCSVELVLPYRVAKM